MRETFRPGWRIFNTITFLLSVLGWVAALHQIKSLSQIVTDEPLRTRTLILATVILPPLAVALFGKNDFARLFLVLMTIFNIITVSLIFLSLFIVIYSDNSAPWQNGLFIYLMSLGGLFAIAIYYGYLIRPCYSLLPSLIPIGRWKAYRQQVIYSLRLWSGQWKSHEEPRATAAGEKPYFTHSARYRLALGWLSFAVGVVLLIITLFSLINEEFVPAICRLEFSTAWHIIRNFQTTPPGDWLSTAFHATYTLSILIAGLFCFFIFGYFWSQWQRENVLIYRTPLLQHMTPSDLLLLRSFSDDVKFVSRKQRIWTILFNLYQWSFTFEELIVNRLKYLGRVRLLDVAQSREKLLRRWWLKVIRKIPGPNSLRKLSIEISLAVWPKLRQLLISVFPAVWYKLPAKGGVRYYIEARRDEKKWQEEIEKAMSLARVIVVLLGTTDSLFWEMGRIEQLHLTRKTLFVMPPLMRDKDYRARWQQFIDFVCATHDYDRRLLEKLNPKNILAVSILENTMVIITGKNRSQTFYESALDVATILVITDPAQSAKIISKYLRQT
jgi:hypothetical protein